MQLTLRAVFLAIALAGTSFAAPTPSSDDDSNAFDLDALAALPAPSTVDQAVVSATVDVASVVASVVATALPAVPTLVQEGAASAAADGNLRRRDASSQFLPASAYSGTNTVASFQSNAAWIADGANAAVDGFTNVYNGQKSVRGDMPGVLSISTINEYSPSICASRCKANKLCQSFALWYERTPSVPVTAANPSPEPAYFVKCLTYSYPLNAADATNAGQWAGNQFYRTQVGVAFLNANNFVTPSVAGYDAPQSLPGSIFLSSTDVANNGGVDPLVTTPGPMTSIADPTVCKKVCDKINTDTNYYNGVRKFCNFFTLFELSVADKSTAYQCQYYTTKYGVDQALEHGGYDSKGRRIRVTGAWGYSLSAAQPAYLTQG